jgi:hypothetical protein
MFAKLAGYAIAATAVLTDKEWRSNHNSPESHGKLPKYINLEQAQLTLAPVCIAFCVVTVGRVGVVVSRSLEEKLEENRKAHSLRNELNY